MKFSFIFLVLLLIAVHETGTVEMNPFKFHKATLNQFNRARRIIASGDVSKLLEIIKSLSPFDKLYKKKVFGPAANMYKLVWNRALEQAAFEYVTENGFKITKVGTTLYHRDFVGFHWMGDIMSLAQMVLGQTPKFFQDKFEAYKDLIETLIITVWMAVAMPKELPIKEGDHFSAGEAVYANRYEIGCYSNIIVAICFLKSISYQPKLFLPGAACSSCPTHCEFEINEFGDHEDGELCVPPTGYYEKQKAEIAAVMSSSSGTAIVLITLLVIVNFIRK